MSTITKGTKTDEAALGIEKEILQLLMEIGFLGADNFMPDIAEKLFVGIAAVRPKSELPLLGLGLCAMAKTNFPLAAYILGKKALPLNPKSSHVKNFLALALIRTGHVKNASDLAKEVLNDSSDPKEKEFAQNILNEIAKKS